MLVLILVVLVIALLLALLTAVGLVLWTLVLAQVVLHTWYRLYMGGEAMPLLAVVRVQIHETFAWFKVWFWHFTWWSPFAPTGDRPVLAIHGYTQNPTNWSGLRRLLRAEGRRCDTVFLGFPWPWRSVEGYGGPLERTLDALKARGQRVDVVVHSMGGLVLRELLARREDLREVLGHVVTLGTPHHGTASARLPLLRPAPQLAYESPWIQALPTLTAMLSPAAVTTIGSSMDLVVYPEATTRQPGATHHVVSHVGHAGLLVDSTVLQLAVAALRPRAGYAAPTEESCR